MLSPGSMSARNASGEGPFRRLPALVALALLAVWPAQAEPIFAGGAGGGWSWWILAAIVLALAAAIYGAVAWRLGSSRRRIDLLEREIVEGRRTSAELETANAGLRRIEEKRQQVVGELEQRNAEMERFIYTVSHDLKSPLITIRGFLGMAEKDLDAGNSDRLRNDMLRIHAAAGRMSLLLDDLLELSRIGRLINEPEEVALGELAREAAEQLAGAIEESGVEVVIAPDLPIVRGDRQRLFEVYQSLVENGVKFSLGAEAPRIEVGCRRNAAPPIFFVRDNGAGIEPRYQRKVFDLFERLDPSIDGTGIGLAIVQRIVELHGGRIWVESEGAGCGSTFCFTLSSSDAAAKIAG